MQPSSSTSAVAAVKGASARKTDLIVEKAEFASVRGPLRYGSNHFSIQTFCLQDVGSGRRTRCLCSNTLATIVTDDHDITNSV
jgi:branched-chain amino acid transport system substrate-binding protein